LRVFGPIVGLCALVLALFMPAPAHAQYWQCVGYAREITGVEIRGNANTWWNQAEGRYARGKAPREGAVMAFKANSGMPMGHVAVVSRIVSAREVLLDHANWSRGGRIEHGVRAVDVSDAGDWSAVKVWFAPIGDVGTRVNPVAGFIYPDTPAQPATRSQYTRGPLIGQDVIQLAALEMSVTR
jgi:surface antigen